MRKKVQYPVQYSEEDPILGYTDDAMTALRWLEECCQGLETNIDVEFRNEMWVLKKLDCTKKNEILNQSRLPKGKKMAKGRQIRFTHSTIPDHEFVKLIEYCRQNFQTISQVVALAVSDFLAEVKASETPPPQSDDDLQRMRQRRR